MKAKPKACSRTSRGSTTSPKSKSDPASPSRARSNSSPPAKPWEASKPTASSQIPLTPGSCSPRSLSLLRHQSENVPHQENAQSSGKRFEPIGRKHVGAHFGIYTDAKHYETRGHGWKGTHISRNTAVRTAERSARGKPAFRT